MRVAFAFRLLPSEPGYHVSWIKNHLDAAGCRLAKYLADYDGDGAIRDARCRIAVQHGSSIAEVIPGAGSLQHTSRATTSGTILRTQGVTQLRREARKTQ
jgi:hypothetical protein